ERPRRVRQRAQLTRPAFFPSKRGFLLCAAVPMLLAFDARASADEPDEPGTDSSPGSQEEKPAASPTAAPTPHPSETTASAKATQDSASFLEHMGPETFPGRLRGIYGGSLWLEPDFQGLQWPQNTRTGLGVSADFWVDSGKEVITRGTNQQPNSDLLYQQG